MLLTDYVHECLVLKLTNLHPENHVIKIQASITFKQAHLKYRDYNVTCSKTSNVLFGFFRVSLLLLLFFDSLSFWKVELLSCCLFPRKQIKALYRPSLRPTGFRLLIRACVCEAEMGLHADVNWAALIAKCQGCRKFRGCERCADEIFLDRSIKPQTDATLSLVYVWVVEIKWMFGPVSGVRITVQCDTQQTQLMASVHCSERREWVAAVQRTEWKTD